MRMIDRRRRHRHRAALRRDLEARLAARPQPTPSTRLQADNASEATGAGTKPLPARWYRQPAITGADVKTTDPNGTTIGPRIEDEHGLPRRSVYSTLAEDLLRLTNKPDYLANIGASAIRTG
jgi:hypothetical protein